MFKNKMILFVLSLGVSIIVNAAEPAKAVNQLNSGLVNPGYEEKPAWFKNSFLDIREDVADASAENKRVMLYFYQDGCPYCAKLLRENYAQKEIERKTRAGFDVIAINMWGDRDVVDFDGNDTTEKNFAASLKVMFTPTLLFLNEAGDVLLRVNGFYAPPKFEAALDYIAGHHESKISFREYYRAEAKNATGKLHQQADFLKAPYNLSQRQSGKPLLVLFEQKQCLTCDELHLDIFKREESQALLKKFDVALLDMWSKDIIETVDGQRMPMIQWAKKLNIKYAPSMVMFDASGKEVFRTEAYLRTFHIQSALDYVASAVYLKQPNFQRYISARADELEAQGIHVDLME